MFDVMFRIYFGFAVVCRSKIYEFSLCILRISLWKINQKLSREVSLQAALNVDVAHSYR